MKPEDKARVTIDKKLIESGWTIQNVQPLKLSASLGIAVREFSASTGSVNYKKVFKLIFDALGQSQHQHYNMTTNKIKS